MEYHLDGGHFESLLHQMNNARQEGRFCDVQLTVNTKNIPVHRSVLAACSPYFSGMFSGNFLESDKGMSVVNLSSVVEEAVHLETVIDALYTGKLKLDDFNIAVITQLASFLMIDSLKELCIGFLGDNLHLQTCVRYYILADMYGVEEVEKVAFNIIESRFHDYFIFQDDLLQTSPHHLCRLFEKNVQRYCDVRQVANLLLRWDKYKKDVERTHTALSLFKSICVGLELPTLENLVNYLETYHIPKSLVSEFLQIVHSTISNVSGLALARQTPTCSTQTVNDKCSSGLVVCKEDSQDSNVAETVSDCVLSGAMMSLRGPLVEQNSFESILVLAPSRQLIDQTLETEVERKVPLSLSSYSLEVSLYVTHLHMWLSVGTVHFPDVFDEKANWRIACVQDCVFFVSCTRDKGHRLSLSSLSWSSFCCRPILDGLEGDVKSVIPLAVGGQLYVLVSNRLLSSTRDCYQTEQKYFRLSDKLVWSLVGEVSHNHYSTPLSLVCVSGTCIHVLKADIAVNVARNLLIIKEGHVFDTCRNTINKFSGICYVPSPVRVMVCNGTLYIIDGEGWKRPYNSEKKEWEFPVQVDLSNVKWCRASSLESHFPCVSHIAANSGSSIWELSSFHQCGNALLEMSIGDDGSFSTQIHVPPPFKYFSLATMGQVAADFIGGLKQSQYSHA
ncbi:uncharacterized protein LOC121388767 [Gigantopelta aegis]|uniref:uncharacterized protein LOC121388767 n=1 Tax=Gigantopelta aegis TaxID=1735272 RepID=UPI001B88C154|nr:uncharacterized protein LOC121388767 [Gigantopelta aegis]